jgi:hypothetical protein
MANVETNRTAELLVKDVAALAAQLEIVIDALVEVDTEETYAEEVAAAKVVLNSAIEPNPYVIE